MKPPSCHLRQKHILSRYLFRGDFIGSGPGQMAHARTMNGFVDSTTYEECRRYAEVNLVQVAFQFQLARLVVCHAKIILLATHNHTNVTFRVTKSIAHCGHT